MDAKQFYREAIATASRVIEEVTPADPDRPTPDTQWTVLDLIRHMLYELAWVSDVVNGKTVGEVGDRYDGDLIGDDLVMNWQRHRTNAEEAIAAADPEDIVHLSYTDTTVDNYLMEAGSDEAIHAWDLAQGLGREVVYDHDLAEALLAHARANEESIRSSGLFAPPVAVAEDTDTQTKILALYGRSPDWDSHA